MKALLAWAATGPLGYAGPALAQVTGEAAIPAPDSATRLATSRAVLTVAGKLAVPGAIDFDMPRLAALPQHSLNAGTPWYKSPRRFTGPLLRDVLAACGAQGSRLRMSALNDYRVELPRDDADRYPVIIARLIDDQPMGVRDKGPLFVMYPFDDHAELRSAVYHSRAVWQLRRIDVL